MQICLESSQSFPCKKVQTYGDEGTVIWVCKFMWFHHSTKSIRQVITSISNKHQLSVFGVFVVDLNIPKMNFAFDLLDVEDRSAMLSAEPVHSSHQFGNSRFDHKVYSFVHERLQRTGW